jgi:hypothetical protein
MELGIEDWGLGIRNWEYKRTVNMRNICKFILCFVVICSCNEGKQKDGNTIVTIDSSVHADTSTTASKKTNSLVITPGKSIGELNLGDDASTLTTKLGKPDLSDAAMGKAWTSWTAKQKDAHNKLPELNVFTTYKDSNMRQQTVQLIRTSSADFTTGNGIHLYSSLADIQKAFPIKESGMFRNEKTQNKVVIYDAEADGIAFEIASGSNDQLCTAIIVHPKNIDVMGYYVGYLLSKGFTQLRGIRN